MYDLISAKPCSSATFGECWVIAIAVVIPVVMVFRVWVFRAMVLVSSSDVVSKRIYLLMTAGTAVRVAVCPFL